MSPAIFLLLTTLGFAYPQTQTAPREVSIGEEFTIRYGEEVVVKGIKLRITFSEVLQDSRCPEGAQCIWEGNAKINLEFRKKPKKGLISVVLNTNQPPKDAEYRGYVVKLLKLSPQPKLDEVPNPTAYEATLVALRAP